MRVASIAVNQELRRRPARRISILRRYLPPAHKAELDALVASALAAVKSTQWRPNPRKQPQCFTDCSFCCLAAPWQIDHEEQIRSPLGRRATHQAFEEGAIMNAASGRSCRTIWGTGNWAVMSEFLQTDRYTPSLRYVGAISPSLCLEHLDCV